MPVWLLGLFLQLDASIEVIVRKMFWKKSTRKKRDSLLFALLMFLVFLSLCKKFCFPLERLFFSFSRF